ncbi:MAG: neutral/alkaline non-lysosomal ceramidase N-terminal domain-containing protein [Planctomycetota bacterium]
MRSLVLLLLVLSLQTCNLPELVAQQPAWQAGVASTIITPGELIWMSGYGSRTAPADGKISDLYAKAIVLQDPEGHRVLLITLDLVGIARGISQEICEQLMKQHNLTRAQIAIATSHTHSGPVVGANLRPMFELTDEQWKQIDDYKQSLVQSILDVSAKAIADVSPVKLQSGEGVATFAVNRRTNREADVPMLREAGQLVGPVDHAVPVLSIRTPDGKLKASVFGYACHATVLSGMQWCADWPGFAQKEIESRHPGCTALFWAGCGADQNPLPRRTVELAEQYGRMMADAVDRVLAAPMTEVSGSLKSAYREIDLAYHRIPSKEEIESDAKSADIFIARRARWLLTTIEREGKLSETYPYPIQMWKLGNQITLTTLGGEVVVDFALRLKAELQGESQWVAAYCNDVMAYIPSKRVLLEGGYEGETAMIYYGLPSKWSEQVEEHIFSTTMELEASLK